MTNDYRQPSPLKEVPSVATGNAEGEVIDACPTCGARCRVESDDMGVRDYYALASEPEPLKEGWAFLDDFTDHWEIAWLQEQSSSARYLILTERSRDA